MDCYILGTLHTNREAFWAEAKFHLHEMILFELYHFLLVRWSKEEQFKSTEFRRKLGGRGWPKPVNEDEKDMEEAFVRHLKTD